MASRIFIAGTIAFAGAWTALGLLVQPLSVVDMVAAVLLVAAAVAHVEFTIARERSGRTAPPHHGPHPTMTAFTSVWTFAGALLVPGPLAAVVAVAVSAHVWLRVDRPAGELAHRAVFASSTIMVACLCVGALLDATAVTPARGGLPELMVIGTAILVHRVTNIGLLSLAAIHHSGRSFRRLIVEHASRTVEWVALAMSTILAMLLSGRSPSSALFVVPMLAVLHRMARSGDVDSRAEVNHDEILSNVSWYRAAHGTVRQAGRRGYPVAVLILDMDRFGELNAEHGHLAGDEVLVAVARALQTAGRECDVVGRQSGEEFLFLVPHPDDTLGAIASDALDRITGLVVSTSSSTGPTTIDDLSASIGGARFPDDARSLDELLAAAGRALHDAKRRGPGSIVLRSRPDFLHSYRETRARGTG